MTDDDKKLVDMGDLMERIVGCINNAEHDDEAETLGDAKAYIEAQAAEIARLRDWALQAFTIVEWCCGEGYLLAEPYFDCDDTYMAGVELLGIETAQEARAALGGNDGQ